MTVLEAALNTGVITQSEGHETGYTNKNHWVSKIACVGFLMGVQGL